MLNRGQALLNQGSDAQMLNRGQALLNQGSRAIKPPLDDDVHFRTNAGSARTRSRGHLRFGGLAVEQSANK